MTIRKMLHSQELVPGEIISEAELVRRLGVSRTPVREALHRLEAEGYLLSGPGRGYLIMELDEGDLVKIYRVRAILESAAAKDAAENISQAELGRLKDLFGSMEKARAAGDDSKLVSLNYQFHFAIASGSANEYLEALLGSIYDVFERFRTSALLQPGRREAAALEHGALMKAIESGDGKLAGELADRHSQRALRVRQEAISGGAS